MMSSQSSTLEDKIRLVKWEKEAVKKKYNLLTIHSLLIDNHPKFKQLKQIVDNYNQEQEPDRIKLKQSYVEQLFKMLSELTRISNSENQLQYLNKIYQWAANNHQLDQMDEALPNQKIRPTTATTKARSQSAYSRSTTLRPVSGHFQNRTVKNEELPPLNKKDIKIDYSKLKDGEKEFYCGFRSLHPQYQHPKKRLKEYQRKVFYEEDNDSDVQIIDIEPKVEVNQKKLMQEIDLAEEQQVQAEGVQGENEQALQVNIDDIPIEGEEQADGEAQPQEPPEVIDKLKPKTKVYNNPKGLDQYNHKNYEQAANELRREGNYKEQKIDEDVELAQLGAMWAQGKGRAKSELKRRAQSARMVKQTVGIKYQKPQKEVKPEETQNIVHFENVEPCVVNSKGSRPMTAFVATNPKNREELIKNAFITGKLRGHTSKYEPTTTLSIPSQFSIVEGSLSAHATNPKKRTFQQILRDAQEKVVKQSQEQVIGVKQFFAKNKISIGANRIARSITYNEKELPQGDRFTGLITGMTMLKNPFIKVTKKKKKKKKK